MDYSAIRVVAVILLLTFYPKSFHRENAAFRNGMPHFPFYRAQISAHSSACSIRAPPQSRKTAEKAKKPLTFSVRVNMHQGHTASSSLPIIAGGSPA